MSLLEEIARACRAGTRSCRISQIRVQPQQRRHLTRSAPAASPVFGAAEAEVQAARKYCSDLLLYESHFLLSRGESKLTRNV
jgi:NADH dehydrogenase [ubiquinone] 1 alpha subcomplex assembly factor 6